jgi:hypothetical protein
MTFSSESHFDIKHLPKTKPARKHLGEVAKKPILAHTGSKGMARLCHRSKTGRGQLESLISISVIDSPKILVNTCRLLIPGPVRPQLELGVSFYSCSYRRPPR